VVEEEAAAGTRGAVAVEGKEFLAESAPGRN
jgi:hypothetical protein